MGPTSSPWRVVRDGSIAVINTLTWVTPFALVFNIAGGQALTELRVELLSADDSVKNTSGVLAPAPQVAILDV